MRSIFSLLFFIALNSQAADFAQKCHAVEDDYLVFDINSELAADSDFTWKATAFEDENCKKPYLYFTRYFKILNISGQLIDLKNSKSTYTVLSDEVARALNSIAFCGIKNWKSGVERDVSSAKCEDYQQLNVGQNLYQILKTDGSIILFGANGKGRDGLTTETRPDQWDSEPYVKVQQK